jgi:hypothetical protein
VADDIVTRLRHMAWQGPEGEPWIGEMLRAADEIERLRAVNLSLHRQILDMELTLIHEREARAKSIIKHG